MLRVAAVLGLVPVASGTGTQCPGYVYRRGSADLFLGLLFGRLVLRGVAVVPPVGGGWLFYRDFTTMISCWTPFARK